MTSLIRLFPLALCLLLLSCGSGAATSKRGLPAELPSPDLASLPSLAELQQLKSASGSLVLAGDQAFDSSPGALLEFGSATFTVGSERPFEYGIYEFALGEGETVSAVSGSANTPALGAELWLAISDFETGRWRFLEGPLEIGNFSAAVSGAAGKYSDGDSVFVAAFAYEAGFRLNQLRLDVVDFAQPVWSHIYGGVGEDNIRKVLNGPDDSIYLCGGYALSESSFNQVALAMRVAADGTLLWARSWGEDGYEQGVRAACVDGNGNLIVTGQYRPDAPSEIKIYVLKFSPAGELMSKAVLHDEAEVEEGDVLPLPYDIVAGTEGTCWICGSVGDKGDTSDNNDDSMLLVQMTAELGIEKEVYWDASDPALSSYAQTLTIGSDGKIYVIGGVNQEIGSGGPPPKLVLVRFDAFASYEAAAAYEAAVHPLPTDAVTLPDGRMALLLWGEDDSVGGAMLCEFGQDLAFATQTFFTAGAYMLSSDLAIGPDGELYANGVTFASPSINGGWFCRFGNDLRPERFFGMPQGIADLEVEGFCVTPDGELVSGGSSDTLSAAGAMSWPITSYPYTALGASSVAATFGNLELTLETPAETASDPLGQLDDVQDTVWGNAAFARFSLQD